MFELAPFDLPEGYGDAILPLAAVKQYLSIEADETEFDELLPLLRDAAIDMVEKHSGVIMGPRTGMVWTADHVPPIAARPAAGDAITMQGATLHVPD